MSCASQAAVDPAMVAARMKIFGPENVDASSGALKKDKVLFSWISHITGAVSFNEIATSC